LVPLTDGKFWSFVKDFEDIFAGAHAAARFAESTVPRRRPEGPAGAPWFIHPFFIFSFFPLLGGFSVLI